MVRLHGLLNRPPSGYLHRDNPDGKTYREVPVWATRVQTALLGHPLDDTRAGSGAKGEAR